MIRSTLLTISMAAMIASCSLSKDKMKSTFDEWVQATVGIDLNELRFSESRAFIGERIPTEVRGLENGNFLHVYADYWGQIGIEREQCDVILEFDAPTMTVVRAESVGPGCYTAY